MTNHIFHGAKANQLKSESQGKEAAWLMALFILNCWCGKGLRGGLGDLIRGFLTSNPIPALKRAGFAALGAYSQPFERLPQLGRMRGLVACFRSGHFWI